jgi:gas vesicle protein
MAKKRKISRKKQKAVSKEIETLLREWKETGKMTTSRATYRPKNMEEARKQAAAIAYGKYGVGKAGRKRRKKK